MGQTIWWEKTIGIETGCRNTKQTKTFTLLKWIHGLNKIFLTFYYKEYFTNGFKDFQKNLRIFFEDKNEDYEGKKWLSNFIENIFFSPHIFLPWAVCLDVIENSGMQTRGTQLSPSSRDTFFTGYTLQGCTTQISWRAKNFFLQYSRAKNDMFLLLQRVFLSNKQGKRTKILALQAKLKASGGHIWPAGRMLSMPVIQGVN